MRREAWNHLHEWWKGNHMTPTPLKAGAKKQDIEEYIIACISGIKITLMREIRR